MKLISTTLILGSGLYCLVAVAQKDFQKRVHPDLSGTWVMQQPVNENKTLSEPSELSLFISHREPEIRITRKFTLDGKQQEQELVYYTDDRGETNLSLRGGKTKSKSWSKWEGDRLVTRHSSYSARIAGPPITAQTEVEWQLLAGGSVLIEKVTNTYRSSAEGVDTSISSRDRRVPAMIPPPFSFQRVYKKVP